MLSVLVQITMWFPSPNWTFLIHALHICTPLGTTTHGIGTGSSWERSCYYLTHNQQKPQGKEILWICYSLQSGKGKIWGEQS